MRIGYQKEKLVQISEQSGYRIHDLKKIGAERIQNNEFYVILGAERIPDLLFLKEYGAERISDYGFVVNFRSGADTGFTVS